MASCALQDYRALQYRDGPTKDYMEGMHKTMYKCTAVQYVYNRKKENWRLTVKMDMVMVLAMA